MVIKRIHKHFLIAIRRINLQGELLKIAGYKNETLRIVIDSFFLAKNAGSNREDFLAFLRCEKYRDQLLQDKTPISYEIFGSSRTALVKTICKKAASGSKWCQFLYFITKKMKSPVILEIGTNLGVSGSYILESINNKPESKFITMEGLPQLCEIASRQFSSISSVKNFEVKQGLYDHTFPILLKDKIKFNVIFIDGNHKKNSTLEYFEKLKSIIVSPAIFIFDDINWSNEMKEAWEIIKNDADINYSIDLYEQGIVIIDEQESDKNISFKLHLSY